MARFAAESGDWELETSAQTGRRIKRESKRRVSGRRRRSEDWRSEKLGSFKRKSEQRARKRHG